VITERTRTCTQNRRRPGGQKGRRHPAFGHQGRRVLHRLFRDLQRHQRPHVGRACQRRAGRNQTGSQEKRTHRGTSPGRLARA